MHIQNYLATLEFVNRERAARGLAPLDHLPAGRPGAMTDCVIARAIPGARVGAKTFDAGKGPHQALPGKVKTFVHAFDWENGPAHGERDPASLVEGGIDDDKGCLVPV